MSTDQDKIIKDITAGLNKEYGEGTIITLGDKVGKDVPCIPTGIYELDYDVLGIGGVPRGRIVEVYGPESSGKTTLALTIAASAQKAGGKAGVVDIEHALNPDWMHTIGCNVDGMIISQPDSGEQALEVTEALVKTNAFDVLIVDSIAALVPQAELNGDYGDAQMGLQARLMSQACRKITSVLAGTNCCLIFINQIRSKIGVMFGSPETTTGGRAMAFYASMRIDVRRISTIKESEVAVGNRVKFTTKKNKMFAPYRECEVDLLFDRGFNGVGSLLDKAVSLGIVEKSGSWFAFKGDRIGQGRSKAVDFITEHNLADKIRKEILNA